MADCTEQDLGTVLPYTGSWEARVSLHPLGTGPSPMAHSELQ